MAHLLNPDHVAWKDWVSGESSRTVWFYRTMGERPRKTERWKQLAATLTNPDYRGNFDYRKTQEGHCSLQKLSAKFLTEKEASSRHLNSVLIRPGSQAVGRARGVRLKGHEPTDEELRQFELRRAKSTRVLPKLANKRESDETLAKEIAEELKRERAKRRQLESQLEALTYLSS